MKILITGVNGYVGSALTKELQRKHEIHGLDIQKNSHLPAENYFQWEALHTLPDVDAIIHLAGIAHDTSNTINENKYYEVNLGLTQKIYDHYLSSTSTKFIFFSSVKAVADSIDFGVLSEDTVPNPHSAYGKSKLCAEQYILSQKSPDDKSFYILRPSMIYGYDAKGNLSLLYNVVKKGFPWPLAAFENQRSFAAIGNVCFVVEQLLETTVQQGIYQVCDDEAISTNELIRIIAESLGKNPIFWKLPGKIIKKIANAGDFLHLPLNSERLKKLTESYVVSNEKIKKALNINRLPHSVSEAMIKSFEKQTK